MHDTACCRANAAIVKRLQPASSLKETGPDFARSVSFLPFLHVDATIESAERCSRVTRSPCIPTFNQGRCEVTRCSCSAPRH